MVVGKLDPSITSADKKERTISNSLFNNTLPTYHKIDVIALDLLFHIEGD